MQTRHTKADLVWEMDAAWTGLNEALNRCTEEQLTQVRDSQGWGVKDHLSHMAAWERSVVVFLQGKPRHVGLGVDEALYLTGDEDRINAAIREKHKHLSLAQALADLQEVHSQLLNLIEPMSDDELYRSNSDYQPEGGGARDERPIIGMIYVNSAHHLREHQGWIESLV